MRKQAEDRIWKRHIMCKVRDRESRLDSVMTPIGGLMGGFLQGMMGASLAQSLNPPDQIKEALRAKAEKRKKH